MTSGLAWLGALVSLVAALSYFLLAVRWPYLRDSGHMNVALGAAGAAVAVWGAVRAVRRRRGRRPGIAAAMLAVSFAAFLAAYVYWLSYRLPPADRVVAIGSPAPDFALPDQAGKVWSLAALRGKKALIVFFRGHW